MTSAAYAQVVPPSAVDQVVYGHFSSPHFDELVVAKGTLVQLYRVDKLEAARSSDDVSYRKNAQVQASGSKLILIHEQRLAGLVTSLVAVPRRTSSTLASTSSLPPLTSLWISFEQAKVSCLDFSDLLHAWIITSLHTYEQDLTLSLASPSRTAQPRGLKLDPGGRCALLLVPDDHFAILPTGLVADEFGMDTVVDDDDDDEDDQWSAQPPPSLLIRFRDFTQEAALASTLCNVIDAAFVAGFNKPTLAVVYQPVQTWQGLRAQEASVANATAGTHTGLNTGACRVTLTTLDLETKTWSILWTLDGLPLETFALFSAPGRSEVGGLFAVSANELIYIDASQRTVTIGVNGYSTAPALKDCKSLDLDNAKIVWSTLAQGYAPFLFLQDGAIYQVVFALDGRNVVGITLDFIGKSTVASCVSSLGSKDQLLFVGSRLGPSVLLQVAAEVIKHANGLSGPVDTLDEDIYGGADMDGVDGSATFYKVRVSVADILQNHGLIRDLVVAERAETGRREVVACCGVNDQGSLAVFHPTLGLERQILAKDLGTPTRLWELALGTNMWLVCSDGITTQVAYKDGEKELSIDTDFATLLLQPLTNPDHYCQITERAILLFRTQDGELVQAHEFDEEIGEGDPVEAHLVDTILAVRFGDRRIALYQIGDDLQLNRLPMPDSMENAGIVSIHLFKETIPLIKSEAVANSRRPQVTNGLSGHKRRKLSEFQSSDDDDDLYAKPVPTRHETNGETKFAVSEPGDHDKFLSIARQDGAFQIFLVPAFKSVFASGELADLSSTLSDGGSAQAGNDEQCQLSQVRLTRLGHTITSLYLLAIFTNGEIMVYLAKSGRSESSAAHYTNQDRLDVRFIKKAAFTSEDGASLKLVERDGTKAIVLTGSKPSMIGKSDHGAVQQHILDGDLLDLTDDGHYSITDNCICRLAWDDSKAMDTSLPWELHDIGKTPIKVQYHESSSQYIAATASEAPFELFDNEGESIHLEKDDRRFPAYAYTSSLELVSPATWTIVDTFNFEQNELVTGLEVGLLNTHMKAGLREYVVVSTTTARGEDYPARGAVYIFEIIKETEEAHAFKLLCKDFSRQGVTCLTLINGFVAVAINQKIYTKTFENYDRLVNNAFIELGIYSTGLHALRNLLIVTDIHNGLNLLAFQEEPFKLIPVTHESRQLSVANFGFLVDGVNIAFMAMDMSGTLRLSHLEPYDPASMGGQRFIHKGDFCTGSRVTVCRLLYPSARDEKAASRTMLLVASEDGSLALIKPISPAQARTLQSATAYLDSALQPAAGLPSKAFRLAQDEAVQRPSGGPTTDQIVDMDALHRFHLAGVGTRVEASRKGRLEPAAFSKLVQGLQGIVG